MNRKMKPLSLRRAEKVSPEPNTGCWLWAATLSDVGYGQISEAGHRGGTLLAHRVAWELHRGAVPMGLAVLHRCDNRACVNPDHLFLGTNAENSVDMVRKNRQAKGERNPASRLNEASARSIMTQLSAGRDGSDIAKDFGVSKSAVSLIRLGKRWSHLRGER